MTVQQNTTKRRETSYKYYHSLTGNVREEESGGKTKRPRSYMEQFQNRRGPKRRLSRTEINEDGYDDGRK